jgi:hypothetical protein
MKRVLIVVVLVLAAAVLGLWRSSGGVREGLSRVVGASEENSQGSVRDEIRKSFELPAGARIEIQGINGKLDIQTSEGKTTEVYVLRTAESRDTLERRDVRIEQIATGLLVRSQQRSQSLGPPVWREGQGRSHDQSSAPDCPGVEGNQRQRHER